MAPNPATLDAHQWGPDGSLTDPSGNAWSTTPDGRVAENGVADPRTARVFQLYEDASGNVYQMNADDNWWEWTPGQGYYGWTQVAQPFTANASPNDTVVPKTSGQIFDSHENIWSISSDGRVSVDNVADAATANVVALAYVDGNVWQENNQGLWWEKATPGGTWTPGPAPLSPQATMSAAGSFIYRGGGTISDAQGNVWAINAGGQVVMNGNADPNTAGVIEMAFDGTHVWQENDHDLWWSWQPSTPGNYAGWYPSSGTTTVPIPFTPDGSGTENTLIILDNSHNFWEIQNGEVTVNGIADNTTAGVIQLAFENGRVYQENDSGLWWSKATPADTWTPGPGSPTDPVTGATTFGTVDGWVGGSSGNSATDPANWSAGTVPSPGMTLYMIRGGTMNLSGGNLAGDMLLFNVQGQDNTTSPTVNLSNDAALTAGTSEEGSASPTVNVSGTDTLDLVGAYPSGLSATVNLSALSDLTTTDNMVFGSLTVNGAAGSDLIMAGTSVFDGSGVLLNTPQIDGTGTISLSSAQSATGRMEITGGVGSNVSFNISADPGRDNASGLTIDKPGDFHGSLDLGWSYVDLNGLTADSYDIKNDLLTLYKGNTAAASFDVTTQPVYNAPTSLAVEQGTSGIMLSVRGTPGGSDVYQPGGVGAALPIHM